MPPKTARGSRSTRSSRNDRGTHAPPVWPRCSAHAGGIGLTGRRLGMPPLRSRAAELCDRLVATRAVPQIVYGCFLPPSTSRSARPTRSRAIRCRRLRAAGQTLRAAPRTSIPSSRESQTRAPRDNARETPAAAEAPAATPACRRCARLRRAERRRSRRPPAPPRHRTHDYADRSPARSAAGPLR